VVEREVSEERRRERVLVERLLRHEEAAFLEALRLYGPAMLRVALAITRDVALAEDAVQDAWISVLRALASFEGRSSLRRWLTIVAANQAKTRLRKESRTLPLSAFGDEGSQELPSAPFRSDGMWAGAQAWAELPLEQLERSESLERIRAVVAELPPVQRAVLTLRDMEGWSADEVCNVLDLTEVNQRVVLHRARKAVRAAWAEAPLLERGARVDV
jgi:RNA polymerase sigma-70 factor, ECF subfamily